MITNVNIDSAPGKALRGEVHTFVNACLQLLPATARVGGQFVSAFGVVGFSGVKDSRKSVQIAEASASAGIYNANSQINAQEKQSESRSIEKPKQNRSKVVASSKLNESRSRATCSQI